MARKKSPTLLPDTSCLQLVRLEADVLSDNYSGPSPKEVSLLATDNQKDRISRTCLNWREVTREEKYKAQTEEERDLVKALYRSSSMEQALP